MTASGDTTSHTLKKDGHKLICDIANKHGIQTGLQATGNFGRSLLKEDVSNEIIAKMIPEVNTAIERVTMKL